MQFELASGTVHYVFRTMDLVGGSSNYGDTHLIGWSLGRATLDPGSMDLSAALPATFVRDGADLLPLTLAAPRPVVSLPPSTIQLAIDNVPAGSPFGAVLLGLQNPGLNLTALGRPCCLPVHGWPRNGVVPGAWHQPRGAVCGAKPLRASRSRPKPWFWPHRPI